MNGPARQEIQLTAESIPGEIFDLRDATRPTEITLLWNPPTIPNGIIIVHEIRYRESNSTGPYNITNTTNTYYSIVGLIPNTSYTIGVRAYTSIGPGEWTDRDYTTGQIHVTLSSTLVSTSSTLMVSAVTSTGTSMRSKLSSTTLMTTTLPSNTMLPNTNGNLAVIYVAAGAVVPLLIMIIIIVIIIIIILKKKRVGKKYDVATKNGLTDKPSSSELDVSTCNINNKSYESVELENIQEATYSTVMKPKKPVIEEFPSNVTTEEGRRVLLKVKVIQAPKLSFNWYHNGEPVTDDYAHELRGDGSLLLVSVEEKHKGTYRFVANNDAGTVSQQVVLTVAVEGSDESRLLHGDSPSAKIGMIPVDKFGEFVAKGHGKGNEGFRNQFG
uniref:Fibronectin type-III domain-containing protein n=1 Tax=Amphimedon queenslandica TaxID=400682 RepID=A0A1X7SNS0_AMPQE